MASEGDGHDGDGQQQPEAGPSTEAAARMLQQLAVREGKALKDKYAFWETQPVAQFSEDSAPDASGKDGPIEVGKRVEDVKQEPYSLPDSYEWSTCDFTDAAVVKEVYELLSNNYVEDDDCMFRFNYSPAFLQWCCKPPGQHPEWLVGVRARTATRRLVAFIAAVPAMVSVDGTGVEMVEINFLCVHKKLRSKRLAPVLIKEITRRVNLHNIWQAAYTAGVLIPKPIGTCRYWHRSLNPKKLVEIGFSRLQPRMTMARTIKLYALNAEPATPGLRAMRPSDVPAVTRLVNSYYSRFRITQVFDEKETAHWFSPQADVIDAYVVEEAATGTITDLVSFYTLPSSVLGHPQHTELKAAYMFYTVPATVSLKQLLNDALIFARNKGYDVFNALDLGQNAEVLKDLKFGIGDGQLHYYLYNWRVTKELTPQEVGLILM